jgi:glycerophosphoryl diester phosphodiesterase
VPLSSERPWIIGHRGVPTEAPENTLSGFALAISRGADLIELDLHMSADGQLVVIHDDTVNRTTNGTGPVGDLSFSQLRALDAGSWMRPRFIGEQIPTLSEALEITADRAGVVVDLKHGSERYAGIEQLLARAIESGDRMDDVIVISRNSEAIRGIHAVNPDVMTLDFSHLSIGSPKWLRSRPLLRPGKRFVFAEASAVQAGHTRHIQGLGYQILTSVLREELNQHLIQTILGAAIDGVFTDHALELRHALKRC